MNTVRGHSQMTSVKFSEFWTPSSPLSVPNPRNLPSFGQNLANPSLPHSADVICEWSLIMLCTIQTLTPNFIFCQFCLGDGIDFGYSVKRHLSPSSLTKNCVNLQTLCKMSLRCAVKLSTTLQMMRAPYRQGSCSLISLMFCRRKNLQQHLSLCTKPPQKIPVIQ